MPTCPIGHDSGTDDYCEVWGRLTAATPPPAPRPFAPPPPTGRRYPTMGGGPEPLGPDPDATAAVELCPRCKTPREGVEPFCEGCRYNFASGEGGQQQPPPFAFAPEGPAQAGFPGAPGGPVPSVPAAGEAPRPPITTPSWPSTTPPPLPPFPDPAPAPLPEPLPEPQRATSPVPDTDYALAAPSGRSVPGGAGPAQATWYVTVVADREYFTAMMARSGPEAQALFFPPYCPERRFELSGHQLRVGRTRHRPGEETPEIDLSRPPEDPGVSHKHAVFVQQPDGTWAVVDQDSTNGTTVNGAEDPITAYVPVQLKDGDRVHLGAWTTITVHRADH
jgi:FHA domain